jgi:hypothetical protein
LRLEKEGKKGKRKGAGGVDDKKKGDKESGADSDGS